LLFPQAHYEIEFRCHFASDAEAFQVLPFLKGSLQREYSWEDNYFGLDLYQSGQVLRSGFIAGRNEVRYHLGWKSPDSGSFANIRREVDEYFYREPVASAILAHFSREKRPYSAPEIAGALEKAGYDKFLSYSGDSLTGRDEKLEVNTKIMHCDLLRRPLLVELEKLADNPEQAAKCEKQLAELCREYGLAEWLVPEEPGTLAFEAFYGKIS
jgi:hypothetical protein